eukprot:CAMPEP_0172624836 /NCGR_PEP_ID=MMETSP1068-20121228/139590_1 /TAXON_ID=35684 /ORGANISM="Pseudopedinella elastica, Strain CCMP716" /LENGTH=483 /DNA_ID=CAMNT_0013433931 /DNA_START=233 /DNA_END=1685 /DNA_ORIENTATION=-
MEAWAGRSKGEDGYNPGDVASGLACATRSLWKRAFGHSLPSECPICCDAPRYRRDWHTLWCGCAVCGECLRRWASATLDDSKGAILAPNEQEKVQLVSLNCPSCSAPLRPGDAADALSRDKALLARYDSALLNASLRGCRDYRPCPHCPAGGFTTWDCIAAARVDAVRRAFIQGCFLAVACMALGAMSVFETFSELWPSSEELLPKERGGAKEPCSVAEVFVTGVAWWASAAGPCGASTFAKFLAVAVAGGVAFLARSLGELVHSSAQEAAGRAALRVGCPSCERPFSLVQGVEDATSSSWVSEHTRPCPRPNCRAPILKAGGCNEMRCGSCNLRFCWACMRPMKQCTHFKCANGGPYGNATSPGGGGARRTPTQPRCQVRIAIASAAAADGIALAMLLLLAAQTSGACSGGLLDQTDFTGGVASCAGAGRALDGILAFPLRALWWICDFLIRSACGAVLAPLVAACALMEARRSMSNARNRL